MPFKKRYKRKRFNRKRQRAPYRKIVRVQRGLQLPAIYPFKRSTSITVGLNTSAPPEGWGVYGNNLYKNWGFSLAQLLDSTDFTQLFKYYKLKGVRLQLYFSNTNSTASQGPATNSPNQQILMWMDTNKDGADVAASGEEKTYLNSQTAKKKLCLRGGKPIDIFCSLRQQNMIYGGLANTDYSTIRPQWISTTEPATPHYGYKMMLQRVDGQPFTSGISNSQYLKIIQTIYFQCKKVE